jgi:hypothetical protein
MIRPNALHTRKGYTLSVALYEPIVVPVTLQEHSTANAMHTYSALLTCSKVDGGWINKLSRINLSRPII